MQVSRICDTSTWLTEEGAYVAKVNGLSVQFERPWVEMVGYLCGIMVNEPESQLPRNTQEEMEKKQGRRAERQARLAIETPEQEQSRKANAKAAAEAQEAAKTEKRRLQYEAALLKERTKQDKKAKNMSWEFKYCRVWSRVDVVNTIWDSATRICM